MQQRSTITFEDLENFEQWLDFYFSKINADVDKNILKFSVDTWIPVLKGLTNEELTNGARNLYHLIQKNQEDGVIQFPISSRIFRNFCKEDWFY